MKIRVSFIDYPCLRNLSSTVHTAFSVSKEFAQRSLCSIDAIYALRTPKDKMADGVDIDLYADDIEQDFAQVLCIYFKTHDNLVVYVSVWKTALCVVLELSGTLVKVVTHRNRFAGCVTPNFVNIKNSSTT